MIKVNGEVVSYGHFPDNTLMMKFDSSFASPYTGKVYYEWFYENDAELFQLICLRRHLSKFKEHKLWMPYIPHARMDRTKSSEDIFTLKYFCEVINSLNFDEVYVRDPHSSVSVALLDRVICDDMGFWVNKCLQHIDCSNLVLFFPDEGAMKRYAGLFTDYPIAFGIKQRNWEDGKIVGLQVVNGDAVKGKDVLIVDDICSYGGTFYHSAKALKELGAERIDLYVTHLESSVYDGAAYTSGIINHFYTTPSLMLAEDVYPNDRKKITVLE